MKLRGSRKSVLGLSVLVLAVLILSGCPGTTDTPLATSTVTITFNGTNDYIGIMVVASAYTAGTTPASDGSNAIAAALADTSSPDGIAVLELLVPTGLTVDIYTIADADEDGTPGSIGDQVEIEESVTITADTSYYYDLALF